MLLLGVTAQPVSAEPAHHHVDEIFSTWDWSLDDVAAKRADIEAMMDELDESVVRAKGILWLDDEPDRQMVLQRVGKRWTLRRGEAWADGQVRRSQLVFIGVRTS